MSPTAINQCGDVTLTYGKHRARGDGKSRWSQVTLYTWPGFPDEVISPEADTVNSSIKGKTTHVLDHWCQGTLPLVGVYTEVVCSYRCSNPSV